MAASAPRLSSSTLLKYQPAREVDGSGETGLKWAQGSIQLVGGGASMQMSSNFQVASGSLSPFPSTAPTKCQRPGAAADLQACSSCCLDVSTWRTLPRAQIWAASHGLHHQTIPARY